MFFIEFIEYITLITAANMTDYKIFDIMLKTFVQCLVHSLKYLCAYHSDDYYRAKGKAVFLSLEYFFICTAVINIFMEICCSETL